MIKIIYRTLVSIIILLLSIIVFLSTFGIKTDKFNSKIISQIKQIEPNVELKLDVVGVTLDPLNFGINLKTIGTDLIYKKIIRALSFFKLLVHTGSIYDQFYRRLCYSVFTTNIYFSSLTRTWTLLRC